MLIKYETSFADGFKDDIALRLIFSGCARGASGNPCPGCHNPELWDFKLDRSCDEESFFKEFISQLQEWKTDGAAHTIVTLIGGEPLDQSKEEAIKALDALKAGGYGELPILLYTGKTEEEIFKSFSEHPFLAAASFIKCGPYIRELDNKDDSSRPALASFNQRIYEREGDKWRPVRD